MPPAETSRQPSKSIFPTPAGEHWVEALDNGTHVLVRPLQAKDRTREKAFIERLSPESRHFRFLCQVKEPSDALLDQLMKVDEDRQAAYVALAHVEGELQEVGITRYAAGADKAECECAVTVLDSWQHHGLGRILLSHLIDHAKAQGFRQMYSIDSAANQPMRDLAKAAGFTTAADPDDPSQVIHRLTL
ncbi:GNAT family N-acetyltransferase [Pseudomonas soli]|jgi:GNAT superfamily N-acetyltransferase|uniref:Acetyltransferase (GNAT) family protein n=1 Tax=Pseudomonas soli TaxID=1306993 RepID=A0A1H9L7U2_9PSED|nr:MULTISPECIES: GNAT family N-acetyltransferase [Pseudomonas]AIN59137.1 GNAT family acetyltransferase [Pseudomonas soli]AUY36809.1 N-acetyltransferase [Pseudomonas sp. PONIH3]MCX5507151.1 GNAT family N-acetyltransferase [Pseudomonas sp. BJa3]MDT3715100.1 GNAT family N-acetyltransferase [Pseudomonas soli]MDT3731513.1 GNAT family N-acetyltransferase [Pseudomonas soli]